ncbi:uncharacterized protein LOC101241009 isoform X1 [Hydra vulgaris]|uniref:uncharacterized protein LOC101241009 isoform X1 n=1 Tax=Hydra vulgaris TaxID=6087 RepID=UPI000640FE3A|nr:vacuolar segregation protein PEP7 [Hydra vulgaris]
MASSLKMDFLSVFKSKQPTLPLPNESSLIPAVGLFKSQSFLVGTNFKDSLSSINAELDSDLGKEDELDGIKRLSSIDKRFSRALFKIRKSHWLDASKINNCMQCDKVFGLTTGSVNKLRKQNCRRCGRVFCENCCQYMKRLSPECIPDPQGNLYRVCFSCAGFPSSQPLGEIRSLTDDFLFSRSKKRLIISQELTRLLHGFKANVNPNSRIKTVVNDTFSIMKVPEWQKSSKWLESSEVELCSQCYSKFSFINSKHHCRLCGFVYCRHCCKANLLLYYDEQQCAAARLIGVVGCPNKEPPVCLYLVICVLCEEDMENYQVMQYHCQQKGNNFSSDKLASLSKILDKLKVFEKKIEDNLPRFQELVDSLTYDNIQLEESSTSTNDIKNIAKIDGDLSDMFTQYSVIVLSLKQHVMSSKTELEIMRNATSLKCKQYNQGINLFKSLRDSLEKSLPKKALLEYQNCANLNAINNTYLMVRQLGFEALRLSLKYDFDAALAEELREVDKVCCEELKSFVVQCGQSWNDHVSVLNEFIKQQLDNKKLVLPKEDKINLEGSLYVKRFLTDRCRTLVYQILHALKSRSSETQFLESKACLQNLFDKMSMNEAGGT